MFVQILISRGPEHSDLLSQSPFSTLFSGLDMAGAKRDLQWAPWLFFFFFLKPGDKAKQMEEKVTPTDGNDVTQILIGNLDLHLLWASHLSELDLLESGSDSAVITYGRLFIQQTSKLVAGDAAGSRPHKVPAIMEFMAWSLQSVSGGDNPYMVITAVTDYYTCDKCYAEEWGV